MTSKNKTLVMMTRRRDLIEVAKRICRYFDIEISLPVHLDECCSGSFLAVDEEYIDLCRKYCETWMKPVSILKVETSKTAFALNLLANLVGDINEIVVGIDPGSRLVYTIIAYSLLIDWGITSWDRISSLLQDICNLPFARRTRIIVSIGAGSGSNKLLEIIDSIKSQKKCNLRVVVVSEYKTNYENIIGIKGIEYIKGQRDFIAAINISLRSLLGRNYIE